MESSGGRSSPSKSIRSLNSSKDDHGSPDRNKVVDAHPDEKQQGALSKSSSQARIERLASTNNDNVQRAVSTNIEKQGRRSFGIHGQKQASTPKRKGPEQDSSTVDISVLPNLKPLSHVHALRRAEEAKQAQKGDVTFSVEDVETFISELEARLAICRRMMGNKKRILSLDPARQAGAKLEDDSSSEENDSEELNKGREILFKALDDREIQMITDYDPYNSSSALEKSQLELRHMFQQYCHTNDVTLGQLVIKMQLIVDGVCKQIPRILDFRQKLKAIEDLLQNNPTDIRKVLITSQAKKQAILQDVEYMKTFVYQLSIVDSLRTKIAPHPIEDVPGLSRRIENLKCTARDMLVHAEDLRLRVQLITSRYLAAIDAMHAIVASS